MLPFSYMQGNISCLRYIIEQGLSSNSSMNDIGYVFFFAFFLIDLHNFNRVHEDEVNKTLF